MSYAICIYNMVFATRFALVTYRVQLAVVGVPHHVIQGECGGGAGNTGSPAKEGLAWT
jgi:hypothetical protein